MQLITDIVPVGIPKQSALKKTETQEEIIQKFGKTKTETIQAFYDDQNK